MEKVIELKNLSYTYPDGTPALIDINLDIFEGETVAILGPNGAGKTTLLLHLNGILNGNMSIKVCDLAVNERNLPQIRKKVGFVFQDPDDQLFMPTVFEDVSFGPVNMELDSIEVEKKVSDALKLVDMENYRERLSHHLSFGEKKRISLATVLSMRPEILVLDEPTGNLDPKHRKSFIKLLKDMDITKVIATHDLDMARSICDRAVIMDRSRVVAVGKAKEILENKKLLEEHGLD